MGTYVHAHQHERTRTWVLNALRYAMEIGKRRAVRAIVRSEIIRARNVLAQPIANIDTGRRIHGDLMTAARMIHAIIGEWPAYYEPARPLFREMKLVTDWLYDYARKGEKH